MRYRVGLPPAGFSVWISKPDLRSPESAARVVCGCQPSFRLMVSAPAPFGALSIPINCSRLVLRNLVEPGPGGLPLVAAAPAVALWFTISGMLVSSAYAQQQDRCCYQAKPGGPGGDVETCSVSVALPLRPEHKSRVLLGENDPEGQYRTFIRLAAKVRIEPNADVSRFPSVRMQHKDRLSWPE